VKPTDTGTGRIASRKTGGSPGSGYVLELTAALKPQLRISGAAQDYTATSADAISQDAWSHVTATNDGTTMTVYINGVANGTPTTPVANINYTVTTTNISIGGLATLEFFKGAISNVRIYNRALSQAEITALYQSYNPGVVVSDLQKGLVGHWDFGAGSTTTATPDRTPYNNDGTVTDATLATDRKSQSNKAYSFASGNYMTVAHSSSLPITGDISISMWIKPTLQANPSRLVTKGIINTDGYEFFIRANGQVAYRTSQSGANQETNTAAGAIVSGNWYHLIIARTGANAKIYSNGVDITSTAAVHVNPTTNTRITYIGTDLDGATHPFVGVIDAVRIYDRALSATEILALYNSYDPGVVVSTLQQGLVGYWDVGAGSTTTATPDRTPYNNDGTVSNATLTTDRKGQSSKAYDFNGTSDYAEVADNATLDFGDTSDFTISGWFNRDTSVNDHVIAAKRNSLSTASDAGYIVYIQGSDDKLYLDISDGTDEYQLASTSTFAATGWNFFVVAWDQDSAANSEIYINGVADSATDTGTIGNVGDLSNSVTLRFGSESDGASYFDGKIDDVRLYNRALSATEVLALYNSY